MLVTYKYKKKVHFGLYKSKFLLNKEKTIEFLNIPTIKWQMSEASKTLLAKCQQMKAAKRAVN